MNQAPNKVRTQLMKLANSLRKTGLSLSQSLTKAWAAIRAKIKLATTDERGIWLTFKKVDGTTRNVLATRDLRHVPSDQQPKNSGKPEGTTIAYYDIWEAAWKCFKAENLISIG